MAADDYQRRAARAYGNVPPPEWAGGPAPGPGMQPPPSVPAPRAPRGRWPKWLSIGLKAFIVLLVLMVLWLTFTAPLNRSLQPLGAPSFTVLSAEGEVIVRKGARISDPVDVTTLPPHVSQAFIAVEDKRFFRHLGVDPYGLSRAMVRNVSAGAAVEGGSTITQQLAKTSFTGADRTAFRKVQEGMIALWLEAWLSKEEILSRYLSNVYFGDNVYGLRAASQHYFSVPPERLTLEQSAMLAGIVNAPSRLAPTRNIEGARERADLVIRRMRTANFITERQAREVRPARLRVGPRDDTPTGTYFADWVLAEMNRGEDDDSYGEREIRTTLEVRLQQSAERIIRSARLGRAQAALVAMRPDGRVVAMVGGRNYSQGAFNRATQARRQPGSTFKLFVYLAALRNGWRPDSIIDDTPLRVGTWSPQNYGRQYRGQITLTEAFAQSSNVAAVRLAQRVGMAEVIRAARDLGITAPLPDTPSLALGSAGVSLLEMTAAFAAVARQSYPVTPVGLAGQQESGGVGRSDPALAALQPLLNGVVTRGTGRAANLNVATYGKTGTTQDYRDALFIGFAGDLIVGVWVGNDDNTPMPGVTGGSAPAQIWRSFMADAIGAGAPAPVAPVEPVDQNEVLPAEPVEPGNVFEPVDTPPPADTGEPIDPDAPDDAPDLPTPTPPPGREPELEEDSPEF
jgi:penicillin-binding protein 1A